jgi:hypothetical protein
MTDAPKPARGTTNTPIRLTGADRAKITAIRERYGLPSLAAAVRFAVDRLHRESARKAK